ncbi:putative ribonuclease H-like domain-containing protein [Tanacetum coccineum]|uniref:Ribonuclease H-like domain-containing protein n=1 Tax=Tanacetum coccineum TaxID=301880 RepID=A0ABQ5DSG4_9ASTR
MTLKDLRGKKRRLMRKMKLSRKKFAQETENLIIKEGAVKPSSTNIFSTVTTPAKASSTNIFSTVSTPAKASSTNLVNTVSLPVSTASPHVGLSLADLTNPEEDDSEIPSLKDIYQDSTKGIFTTSSFDDEGDPNSAVQTRSKVNTSSGAHALVSYVQKQKRTNYKDFHHYLFASFLSQHEPKKISKALEDESWVDATQEELLQFKIQKVWVLVDLPYGYGKEGYQLVAQGHRKEEGIDYDEVFAPVARLEAIRIFLAFASYMGFIVYQMDVKSAFLYGKIDEEVYVSQPPGFLDPKNPQKVYKVVKALYGLHQAPRAWYATLSTFLLKNGYRRGTIDKTLFLKKEKQWRLISLHCKKLGPLWLTSTKKAEYVAAASCCGQVLWIQNQMLDYGFNFMNTKIYIDNESTICIVKNPVYHSKTKHIAIRHHFIRDAYEKKLIQKHVNHRCCISRGLIGFRESLRRVIDGTKALQLPTLFILWLDKVSTDSAKLVPLGKVCTALETLKKNTAKALISLLTTISLSSTMAVLDSCPKHNMVAYLEKSEGNVEFHEIIDFLKRSSIHHALTVAGQVVSISEASIRSDLLFDDADGIDSLPNQAIFDVYRLMGNEGDLHVMRVLLQERPSEALALLPPLIPIVKYLMRSTETSVRILEDIHPVINPFQGYEVTRLPKWSMNLLSFFMCTGLDQAKEFQA